MSLSFVIYSDANKLISRHTVKDLAEKKAVVAVARKAYGKGLKIRDKELVKDRPTGKTRIPMTDVEIKVCLQLDSDVEHTAEELTRAGKQAVGNALQFAYDNGFDHPLADDTSIGIVDISVLRPILLRDVLAEKLPGDSHIAVDMTVKPDGVLLSIGGRGVVLLENKQGLPQLVVYADPNRDEPTDIIPIERKECVASE